MRESVRVFGGERGCGEGCGEVRLSDLYRVCKGNRVRMKEIKVMVML